MAEPGEALKKKERGWNPKRGTTPETWLQTADCSPSTRSLHTIIMSSLEAERRDHGAMFESRPGVNREVLKRRRRPNSCWPVGKAQARLLRRVD